MGRPVCGEWSGTSATALFDYSPNATMKSAKRRTLWKFWFGRRMTKGAMKGQRGYIPGSLSR